MLPIDFAGGRRELSGFLRTENVSSFAGLWMRQDGDSGPLAFDNMESRRLNGTTGWTEYTITLPLAPAAKRLFFGVLASGGGRVWADDLRLLVDGTPLASVARAEPERRCAEGAVGQPGHRRLQVQVAAGDLPEPAGRPSSAAGRVQSPEGALTAG